VFSSLVRPMERARSIRRPAESSTLSTLRVLRNEGLCILVDDVDIFPFAEYAEVVQGRVDKALPSCSRRSDSRSAKREEGNTDWCFPRWCVQWNALSLRVLRNEGLCILVDDVDIFPFAEYAEVVQGRVG
jgi:hypothetical protein